MPLTKKGSKILHNMLSAYTKKGKSKEEAESIFWASANSGKITGVHEGQKK